jgi:hypothetical protein
LTAGYSGTPLSQKLGISAGKTVGILNMPNYYDLDLGDLPPDVEVHRGDFPADIFIIFAERSDEAELGFQNAITFLPPDGAIWVLWPKQSSGVDTDLTEQDLRDLFLPTGMVDNKVIAVDETWSGLRFVVRKENREGWPESTREV